VVPHAASAWYIIAREMTGRGMALGQQSLKGLFGFERFTVAQLVVNNVVHGCADDHGIQILSFHQQLVS
jgi:hypothetical protein